MTKMPMIKKLSEIAWNVPESEYRASADFSYSTLSSFLKNGPKSLVEKNVEQTDSLRFGSIVDCIVTDPLDFDNRFIVINSDKFSASVRAIVESLFYENERFAEMGDVPRNIILNAINSIGYQTNWKDDTRIDKIISAGAGYYKVLSISEGRTIITSDEFMLAQKCVSSLKTNQYVFSVLDENDDFENYYQLKFKSKINGIGVRCMFDIIKVNHKLKKIYPFDLKTTGKDEEDFQNSFFYYNYWLQAFLYKRILEDVISKDDYFKDFTVEPFSFLVINKLNLKPLIYKIDNQKEIEDYILSNIGETYETLLSRANWHVENNKFEYSYDSYINNGVKRIKCK